MIIIEEKYFSIWISLINNLGMKQYKKLIKYFGAKKNLWNAKKSDILKINGINEKLADLITNKEIKKDILRHYKYMEENSIDIISIEDVRYPDLLRNISSPPLNLYIKGNKDILGNISIGIVGCRDATNYGRKVAFDFAYNLAENKINIVSGLARGIDSYAHLGALKANGITIAVLGNGLDMVYPSENKNLAKDILELNGAIISEFPLGTPPKKENFPRRNRIISGLCNGVLVVEAKKQSGTTITIDFALEQGRDVFVIPGNIYSVNSYGTNDIIKQGGKLVTEWNEIIEEYN